MTLRAEFNTNCTLALHRGFVPPEASVGLVAVETLRQAAQAPGAGLPKLVIMAVAATATVGYAAYKFWTKPAPPAPSIPPLGITTAGKPLSQILTEMRESALLMMATAALQARITFLQQQHNYGGRHREILELQTQLNDLIANSFATVGAFPMVTGALEMVATMGGGGNSTPVRKVDIIDTTTLSDEDRKLWDTLRGRLNISSRSLYRYLAENKIPIDHPLLTALVQQSPAMSGADRAIAWYHIYRIVDVNPHYATMFNGVSTLDPKMIVKDIPLNHMPWLWDALAKTVAQHRSPATRHYALEIAHSAMRYDSRDIRAFNAIIESGLQDPDPCNVWLAWKMLNQYFPSQATLITDRDLTAPAQLTIAQSPKFGLAKYVHGTEAQIQMRHEIYMAILDGCDIDVDFMSWMQFQPIHSLADFNPDSSERRPKVYEKLGAFLKLADQFHFDPEMVLHEFLIGNPLQGMDAAKVVVLPSGRAYLIQGHHRVAALIDMAQRGEIPMEWIDRLPVYVMHYNGDVPEAVVRRVLTLGYDLEWSDLLPQRISY